MRTFFYGKNVLAGLYSNVSLLYEFLLHPDLWTTTNVYNFLLFIVNSLGNCLSQLLSDQTYINAFRLLFSFFFAFYDTNKGQDFLLIFNCELSLNQGETKQKNKHGQTEKLSHNNKSIQEDTITEMIHFSFVISVITENRIVLLCTTYFSTFIFLWIEAIISMLA